MMVFIMYTITILLCSIVTMIIVDVLKKLVGVFQIDLIVVEEKIDHRKFYLKIG
jgi:hypothetical protein